MVSFSAEERDLIIDALVERGAQLPCPRCGNEDFSVLSGYFNQPIQVELTAEPAARPSVPSVVAVCTLCGFMSQHSLGALGLMPAPPDEAAGGGG